MKTRALEMERTGPGSREIVKAAASGILSFLFGGASLFGSVSPFGVALVAGFPLKYALTAAVGGILGSCLFLGMGRGLCLSIAMLFTFAARLGLHKVFHRRIKAVFLSLLAFAMTGFSTVFYGIIRQVGPMDFALLAIEAVLTGCFTYFFAISGDAVFRPKVPALLTYTQSASLCLLFIALICSLAGFQIFNVNLGVIFGILSVYIAMSKKGIIGSSIAAIAVSIALNLHTTEMLPFAGMLIIASFIAGAFSPLGKAGQLTSFIVISTFFLFFTGAQIGRANV